MGEWNVRMCEQDKSKLFLIEEVYEMPECEQDKSKLFNRRGICQNCLYCFTEP